MSYVYLGIDKKKQLWIHFGFSSSILSESKKSTHKSQGEGIPPEIFWKMLGLFHGKSHENG